MATATHNNPMKSAIYVGNVFHRRAAPKAHGFRYGVFSLLLDLDELEVLDRELAGFAHNHFSVFGFHNRDHGKRDGSDLRAWCRNTLAEHAIVLENPAFRVLCFPRVLGYTFDPISVWFCYSQDQSGNEHLGAIIYEVHNTFGTDHSYVVDVRAEVQDKASGPLRHARKKQLHVSPFFDVSGGYNFRILPIEQRYHLNIRYYDTQGAFRLVADHQATRLPLTAANLASLFWRKPLVTMKVVWGIHWEALHLFTRKSARYHHPTAAVDTQSSSIEFSKQYPQNSDPKNQ